MGRTNMMLLGMGILACVVLSLLMQRGLKLQMTARIDPVVKAVTEVFGGRLQVPPRFRIDAKGDRRVGLLDLVPHLAGGSQRLTADVGRFVWQQAHGRFDDLVVLVKRDPEDKGTPVPIPRPFLVGTLEAKRPPRAPASMPATRKPSPASQPSR